MKINIFFIQETQSRKYNKDWVLCHISIVFISIQQKGIPVMVTPST